MATKKKANKKKRTTAKTAARKRTPVKNRALKTRTRKPAKREKGHKEVGLERKARGKTKTTKARKAAKKQVREKSEIMSAAFSGVRQPRQLSGQQSGDLQGLSRAESADSESVDELVEEGNPFEANVVTGVEDADNAGERAVRTHEVPEDDVPDEYLDKE